MLGRTHTSCYNFAASLNIYPEEVQLVGLSHQDPHHLGRIGAVNFAVMNNWSLFVESGCHDRFLTAIDYTYFDYVKSSHILLGRFG